MESFNLKTNFKNLTYLGGGGGGWGSSVGVRKKKLGFLNLKFFFKKNNFFNIVGGSG